MTWPPLLQSCTAARMLEASSVTRSLWDEATQVRLRDGDVRAWKGRGVRRVSRKFSATETENATLASSSAVRNEVERGSILKLL